MRKIEELTAIELSECLCKIAEPAENLFSDVTVRNALDEFKTTMPEKATWKQALSVFASVLYPVLSGEKHRFDVYTILAAIDGVSVAEIENRNGLEVMGNMFKVFVQDGDVQDLFRPVCEIRRK